jgi:hypothetical protein
VKRNTRERNSGATRHLNNTVVLLTGSDILPRKVRPLPCFRWSRAPRSVPYGRDQDKTGALTDNLQISTAMAGAMVSNKTRVAGLGVVGLSKGSARVAYLTKAQIQFKLLALEIRKRAPEATGERRVGVEIQCPRK